MGQGRFPCTHHLQAGRRLNPLSRTLGAEVRLSHLLKFSPHSLDPGRPWASWGVLCRPSPRVCLAPWKWGTRGEALLPVGLLLQDNNPTDPPTLATPWSQPSLRAGEKTRLCPGRNASHSQPKSQRTRKRSRSSWSHCSSRELQGRVSPSSSVKQEHATYLPVGRSVQGGGRISPGVLCLKKDAAPARPAGVAQRPLLETWG